MNVNEVNVLVLAYLGDNIYEYYVRRHLISNGVSNVNDLQKNAVNYVSAVNQAKFLSELIIILFWTYNKRILILHTSASASVSIVLVHVYK